MDILKCKICGFECKSLITHIKFKHNINSNEYKKRYNVNCLHINSHECRKKISESLKKLNENVEIRKENSMRQKNGASRFTIQYWINRGLNKDAAIEKVSEIQKCNSKRHHLKNDLQECSHFSIKYWVKRGFNENEAKMNISKIQKKLSARSSKFLGCKRTVTDKLQISDSMKTFIRQHGKGKWASHFGIFNGRSKIEIQFYEYIKHNIDDKVEANIPINNYIVDVIKDKKIIEFYGDFWHGNPSIFSKHDMINPYGSERMKIDEIWKKDAYRTHVLKNDGYDILVIWESDWIKNKEECVTKIKKYLYDL